MSESGPMSDTDPTRSAADPGAGPGHAQAPGSLIGTLMALGPGIIVAANVIGSGELINAPVQAAKFGFVLLWAVVLSCVIKYFLQVEIGRHAILHNRTTFQSLNLCPGPKFRETSWVTWVYMVGYTVTQVGLVGILLATSGLFHSVLPLGSDKSLSITIWGIVIYAVTQFLLWKSVYRGFEIIVTSIVVAFSLAALVSLVLIQSTNYRIESIDILGGLRFSFGESPGAGAIAVISFIGALGTTANELFQYPYWLLENGYAKRIGDPTSEGWVERGRGWVRVLRVDVAASTLIATVLTVSFFLLGATVLHGTGEVPAGIDVVLQIGRVFTETYGESSKILFVLGGIAALYSSFLVSSAASGRMGADLMVSTGRISRDNPRAVRRAQQLFQSAYLGAVLVIFLILKAGKPPAEIVIFAQFVNGVFNTPLLMFGICVMAFSTDRRLRMGRWSAAGLVLSVVLVTGCILAAIGVKLLNE
jgi:manganese transport protein